MDMTLTLGSLIIVGFALVMGARWLSKKQQQGQIDEEEIRFSTEQLKAEMERSADAVIGRLGSHIKHLETLLQEAEDKNRKLEFQLEQARKTEDSLRQQSCQLTADIQEARRVSQELASRSLVQPSVIPVMAPMTGTSRPVQEAARMTLPPQTAERVDAQNFAAVLQQSMERDGQLHSEIQVPPVSVQQAAGLAEAMSNRPAVEVPEAPKASKKEQQTDNLPEDVPDMEISPNAARARALLLSGYTVEETARETGIGKGAIELLREMNRHELENS